MPFGHELGIEIFYLVEGTDLAGLKDDSLQVSSLRGRDGADLSVTRTGTATVSLGPFPSTTDDGRHLFFSLRSQEDLFGRVDERSLRGSVVVFTGSRREREGRLIVGGADSAEELPGLLEAPAAANGIQTDADLSGLGGSDHLSFIRVGVPALFFTSGGFDGYHSPDDTSAEINYTGLADVSGMTYDVLADLAAWPAALTFNPDAGPAVGQGGQRAGLSVTMGTVPHFGSEPAVPGMGIDDVIQDGPAALAGLLGGDVIVKILDWKIASIQDFMFALQDCSPGQIVPVKVWRDGEELVFQVELAARNIEQ